MELLSPFLLDPGTLYIVDDEDPLPVAAQTVFIASPLVLRKLVSVVQVVSRPGMLAV